MEPRFLQRGNSLAMLIISRRRYSFNGATLSSAWKLAKFSYSLLIRCSFNGATLSSAWKHSSERESGPLLRVTL